ncbi:hypothetical protein [Citrobacter cronae]|uniref:hypothetical protein n=1 Tax=Citrobacter cronae TaxID=1748967 RepID=UPI001F2EEC03|nr:hypothetical protein [Citrobacter cronae]MCM8843289.1 hypothetical protein [Citrobacter cronae]
MRTRSTFFFCEQSRLHGAVSLFLRVFTQDGALLGKLIFVLDGDFAVKERIGIANLIIFVVKRSNMKRVPFLSVSYQNKMTKDFFVHASPYSYYIAPVRPLSPSTSG